MTESYLINVFHKSKNYLSGVWNQITENEMIFKELNELKYTNIAEDRLFYCGLPSNVTTMNGEPREAQIRFYNMRLYTGRRGQSQKMTVHEFLLSL
jgi:hypothetical protein